MEYALWLDDLRNPATQSVSLYLRHEVVLWARDLEQAKFYVERHGSPKELFLDHDLGILAYGLQEAMVNGAEETGMDFLLWWNERYPEAIATTTVTIISANPVGRQAMKRYVDRWMERVTG